MGKLRGDVERLIRLLPDPVGQANGLVVTTQSYAGPNGTTQYGYVLAASGGTGTVSSVDVSGGTTGLTTSGGPITTGGTITLGGTLVVANGGTGATTASGARANLSAAPNTPSYVTLATNAELTSERVLTAGTGISVTDNGAGSTVVIAATGGSGTVTNFSAGNLSPLFTTSVATATTTPALTFALSTQTANTVFAGPTGGGAATPTFRDLVAADIPALSYQAPTQIQDEGVNQGTAGQATTLNVVGGSASIAVAGAVATLTVANPLQVDFYGQAYDGNCVADGTNTFPWASKVGNIYTLNRDVYLGNLTVSGAAQIVTGGMQVFGNGTLTCTTSASPVFDARGGNGANAVNQSGGANGSTTTANNMCGAGNTGTAGNNGSIGVGAAGTSSVISGRPLMGGGGGAGGNGGAGGAGAGGNGGALSTVSTQFAPDFLPQSSRGACTSAGVIAPIRAGASGASGGAGAGNGAAQIAGGAGGGPGGGGSFYIAFRIITKMSAGVLAACDGGNGGNGGNAVGTNCGGGGAAGGAGAGWGKLVFESMTGSGSIIITANGGNGGTGGTKTGTGVNGSGGGRGAGGFLTTYNTSDGTQNIAFGTFAGTAASGVGVTTGQTGEAVSITL